MALRSQRGFTVESEIANKSQQNLRESHLHSELFEPYWEATEGNEDFTEEELKKKVARTAFP